METPGFEMSSKWTLERLIGYLNTWSAVKTYEKEKGENPVDLIRADLAESFGEVRQVKFPILIRVGRNNR